MCSAIPRWTVPTPGRRAHGGAPSRSQTARTSASTESHVIACGLVPHALRARCSISGQRECGKTSKSTCAKAAISVDRRLPSGWMLIKAPPRNASCTEDQRRRSNRHHGAVETNYELHRAGVIELNLAPPLAGLVSWRLLTRSKNRSSRSEQNCAWPSPLRRS